MIEYGWKRDLDYEAGYNTETELLNSGYTIKRFNDLNQNLKDFIIKKESEELIQLGWAKTIALNTRPHGNIMFYYRSRNQKIKKIINNIKNGI